MRNWEWPERREASKGKRRIAREWRAQITWSTCLALFMLEITSPTLSRTCASTCLFLFAPSSMLSASKLLVLYQQFLFCFQKHEIVFRHQGKSCRNRKHKVSISINCEIKRECFGKSKKNIYQKNNSWIYVNDEIERERVREQC